ncbi:MAG: chorismate mutase [Candidatus Woesearchaeota archaeon]|jgi:chorismate mutase/uncharacterized HAD superfamily protein|nr:chorismate mutase [Candidatus Woesearchaeota archaeon]MDP7181150.1 chorismate mutase [Candidatus Woesearchaeota archaeon]MDP7198229.1 chorismate mutase [Candidatus Woesearchaeota archaeon]MDP7467065.1 chorismate mutase [Candidatus Woesearchaeota archaeon]MDP7646733.1 chorismate mutase [Candidatus Woesearchaeota archaeon]
MDRIGIDFDGTITNHQKWKKDWASMNAGWLLFGHQTETTEMINIIGEENYARLKEELIANNEEITLNAELHPQVEETLRRLAQQKELYLITKRPPCRLGFAEQKLAMHGLTKYFKDIVGAEDKSEACKKLDIACLVDDDRRHFPGLPCKAIWFVPATTVPEDTSRVRVATDWEGVHTLARTWGRGPQPAYRWLHESDPSVIPPGDSFLRPYAVRTEMDLQEARTALDKLDTEILQTLAKRYELAKPIAEYKTEHGLPTEDKEREFAMIKKRAEQFKELGFDDPQFIQKLFELILEKSKQEQHG